MIRGLITSPGAGEASTCWDGPYLVLWHPLLLNRGQMQDECAPVSLNLFFVVLVINTVNVSFLRFHLATTKKLIHSAGKGFSALKA